MALNALKLTQLSDGSNAFARKPATHVDARALVAATNAAHTKPAGAKFCLFSADGDFYARPDATAAVPVGAVTDGSGSECNPTIWDVSDITTINLIASEARKITLSFYD